MTIVIIAGSRNFDDYPFLKLMLNGLYENKAISVLSGGQKSYDKDDGHVFSADHFGEQWAIERGISPVVMKAEWGRYGQAAGPIRNRAMAEIADELVAFWDGESPGTKNMIDVARTRRLVVHVIEFVGFEDIGVTPPAPPASGSPPSTPAGSP